MIALLQRVTYAHVEVAGERVAQIGPGLLALIGIERADTSAHVARLLERMLSYRLFADDAGRMNRSLRECGGGLLLVPQFTLAADTDQGTRAGFSRAAAPELARSLFEQLTVEARSVYPAVSAGVFGAHMAVSLLNDGPVTFWLEA
ncbi:MAG: D-tyrosyl-tRNA(Tyr) deacylase [Gammaproteobacteria bacterium]|nr:D-tyrosyl-tRNA(Tyr) deacylase [Gammaproteobacteria bacterium]